MISIKKFTTLFGLYIFASIIVSLTASFTSAAWIIYAFSLLPFYLVCVLYCLNLYIQHRHQQIVITPRAWFAVLICQVLFILTSSADCYMWSQGRACYSLVQTYLEQTRLDPPHWTVVEAIFPISLLSYIILTIVVLKKARIQS